jgi:hypothetical protein
MFLIARYLVLHPRHKLDYFKRNKWDDTSINAACDSVQDAFDQSYWLLDVKGDNNTMQTDKDTTVSGSFSVLCFLMMLNTNTGFNN